MPSASLAVKVNDNSMEPKLKKGDFAFIEFNSLLTNYRTPRTSYTPHRIFVR
jgi:hypothetical protein